MSTLSGYVQDCKDAVCVTLYFLKNCPSLLGVYHPSCCTAESSEPSGGDLHPEGDDCLLGVCQKVCYPHYYLTLQAHGLQPCGFFKHAARLLCAVPLLFHSWERCTVWEISSSLDGVLSPLLTITILSSAGVCQGVSCVIYCFLNDLARVIPFTDPCRHWAAVTINRSASKLLHCWGCWRSCFTSALHLHFLCH